MEIIGRIAGYARATYQRLDLMRLDHGLRRRARAGDLSPGDDAIAAENWVTRTPKLLGLAVFALTAVVLAGCSSTSSAPVGMETGSASVPSKEPNGGLDLEAIQEASIEMSEIADGMGMVGTLSAEACLQEDQAKLDALDQQVTELLNRAEAVPDGGSANMVVARTAAQRALRKATEGLQTCDPATWMDVVADMEASASALNSVALETEEAGS